MNEPPPADNAFEQDKPGTAGRDRAEASIEALRQRGGIAERQAFLLALGDAIRDAASADEKIRVAASHLGQQLGASRVLYAEFDWDRGVADIFSGWLADGAQPVPTVMRLEDYDGEVLNDLRAGRTVRIDDVGLLTADPSYAAIADLGVQSLLSVPLLVGGQLKVNVSVHQHEPRRWTDGDAALVQEVAERLWAEVVRARAEAALRASEAKFRALFDSIDEGLAIVEMIYDDGGEIVDMVFRQVNEAYERQGGIYDVVGRSVLEMLPGVESIWLDRYRQVAKTGEPLRVEDYQQDVGRWFDVYFTRVDDDGRFVAIVFNDITSRKQAEAEARERQERQAFLLRFSDGLRPLHGSSEIQGEATRLLREHFDCGWCFYVDWDSAGKVGTILRHAAREGLPSLVGAHDVSDAPDFLDLLATGEVLKIRDYAGFEQLSPRVRDAYPALGFRSMMIAPLVKEGRLIASLVAGDTEVRDWSAEEASLLTEVAERTWAAAERVHAEEALRDSEERFRTLFESIDEGFRILELIEDDKGKAVDFRYVEANEEHDRQAGLGYVVGKLASEVVPGAEAYWFETFGEVARTGEPKRYENYNQDTGRWYDVFLSRVGGAGSRRVCVVSHDSTERKQREERQAFLLRFSDALRAEPDENAVANRAIAMLADQLQLDRCYIAVYWLENDWADFTHQVGNDRVPPLPAGTRLSDFPETLRMATAGTVAFDDIATNEDLSETDRKNLAALGCNAILAATLRRGENNPHWVIAAVSASLRRWTRGEIALIEEVTERTWAAMEGARAEAALRESEETLAADLANAELLRGLAERLVTEENVGTIYEEILSAAMAVARADAGTIQIYDEKTKSLEIIASRNFSRTATDYFHRVDASSRTACGVAMRTGERAFVDFPDEVEDPGCQLLVGEGIQSALALPLVSRSGKPLGMLNTHWRETRHRPTDKQLRFLELIARQAADLIEQRQAQSVLRASEERFRRFGEASDILWIRDAETLQWIYLTPAFETIYGLSCEEALKGDNYTSWLDLIVPEDRERAEQAIERVRAGEHATFEYRVKRPSDGRICRLRNTDFPIANGGGKVAWIGGIGHDVTALRESEERRRTSEERFGLIVENARDYAIFTTDAEGRIDSWHQGAAAVFGWTAEEAVGQAADITFTHQDRADGEPGKERDGAARDGRTPDVRWHVRKDGRRIFIDGVATALRDPSGALTGFLKIGQDVTERRRGEERQQTLLAELQHRVRNIMAMIRSVARRTQESAETVEDYAEHLEGRISAMARTQALLTRDVHAAVDLQNLVLDELDMQAAQPDQFRLAGPDVALPAKAAEVLGLALHELATNSVKYGALSAPGGRIDVRWALLDGDDRPQLSLIWSEFGVTIDGEPTRQGFGTELITQRVPYELQGTGTIEFRPTGLVATLEFPLADQPSILQTNEGKQATS